jgi:hypothetical protein
MVNHIDFKESYLKRQFIPWYRLGTEVLGDLVESLTDIEVMEYVSTEGVLTIPVVGVVGDLKPMPVIEVSPRGEEVSLAISYRDAACLRHLKNLLHPSQTSELENFVAVMRLLPASFETLLMKGGLHDGLEFNVFRKYVSCRVDSTVLQLLIGEAELLRSGGRRIVEGRSVYEAPTTPNLLLISVKVKVEGNEFKSTLQTLRPVIEHLTAIKTQREIIHSRLAKPGNQAKQYRIFIDLLNKARSENFILSEERRTLEKRWRDDPDSRIELEEELKRKIGATI